MKTFRNLLLAIWFGWFVLAGIVIAALLVWLTPWSLSAWAIIGLGTLGGLGTGLGVAVLIVWALWRKLGAPIMRSYAVWQMFRNAIFNRSSRINW